MNKVSVIPEAETSAATQPPAVLTPMALIERALASGAGMDVIEKFMILQERWEQNQARKDFDASIAAAKAEIPPITRNATGHNDKKYADFSAIAAVVDPILGKHGLSYRFRTVQTDRISVTCVLSHKSGHSEETTLAGPPDATGSKNAIQAIGSTLTYLQRYSLVQMLGLAAARDDDGRSAAGGEKISLDRAEYLIALCEEVSADKDALCKYFKIASIADLAAKDFDRAVAALNKKRSAK